MGFIRDLNGACESAVKWWTENIGTGNRTSVSDESRRTPTNDERNQFNSILFDAIIEMFRETDIVCLSSNYKPEGLLEEVAKECGMSDVIFPNNAIMCVSYNQVILYNSTNNNQRVLFGTKCKKMDNDLCID